MPYIQGNSFLLCYRPDVAVASTHTEPMHARSSRLRGISIMAMALRYALYVSAEKLPKYRRMAAAPKRSAQDIIRQPLIMNIEPSFMDESSDKNFLMDTAPAFLRPALSGAFLFPQ